LLLLKSVRLIAASLQIGLTHCGRLSNFDYDVVSELSNRSLLPFSSCCNLILVHRIDLVIFN
jgi:hypothetical protein